LIQLELARRRAGSNSQSGEKLCTSPGRRFGVDIWLDPFPGEEYGAMSLPGQTADYCIQSRRAQDTENDDLTATYLRN